MKTIFDLVKQEFIENSFHIKSEKSESRNFRFSASIGVLARHAPLKNSRRAYDTNEITGILTFPTLCKNYF